MKLKKYMRLPQYEVGKYQQKSLGQVQALFSQAFGGRRLSVRMLKWQMEDNPCLQKRATTLWQEDTLVAYNALTPSYAVLDGKEVVAAVSGTTMADVHFPGASLQLFTECARQNRDISIIYGFPNHNSYGITVKYLDHRYVGDVSFWTAQAVRTEASDKIKEFFSFSHEYEGISKELSKEHEFIKIRKSAFLNWRFFLKPEYEYRGFEFVDEKGKHGYIVVDIYVENEVKQLQVVDIIADSPNVMKQLLLYSIHLAYQWSCEVVKLWLTSENYEDVLVESGFVYGEHPFAMTVWNQDLNIKKSYITMADSDIF